MESSLLNSVARASILAIMPMGLWAICFWGSNKTWYFQTSTTSMSFGLARFWYFVFPFLGIAFLFFGVADFYLGKDPQSTSIWFYVGVACILVGFICGFTQPNLLSPHWLKRLKSQYGIILPFLLEDAVGMDKKDLKAKTTKWVDLEEWISEVCEKNNILPDADN